MKYLLHVLLRLLFFAILFFGFAIREEYMPMPTLLPATVPVLDSAVPAYFSIDRLGVYAPIQPVGIVAGAMDVPDTANHVGWYQYGPRPGDIGSAVVAGHVNWNGGEAAIFSSLHTIQIGDTVEVFDSTGKTASFAVTHIKEYPIDADTTEVFSSGEGTRQLNIITCSGPWDPILKTHSLRLVVFTEKM